MSEPVCPLCRESKRMRKAKPLYGVPICPKCYYKFANRRQVAYLLDWIVFQFAMFYAALGIGVALAAAQAPQNAIDNLGLLAAWLIFPMIFFLKDGFSGHSPGKAIIGVQVVNPETFKPIGFVSSFKRNLPLLIPFMALIIAFLLQKGYRLGDGWAHSKVIWKKYANHPVFTGRLACEQCQYDLTGNVSGICPECGARIAGFVVHHFCPQCKYDLTGNTSGACPECGTIVPPPVGEAPAPG